MSVAIYQKYLFCIIFFIITGNYLGCAIKQKFPSCEKNGKEYCKLNGAFRNRWYNFYELGLSYMEGQCYEEAINFFQRAIQIRKEDKRMARKYGIHLIDYFPNRESGIIQYFLGNYTLAEKHLEQSITQESSAKAYHFLDKVRARLMDKEKSIGAPKFFINRDFLLTNSDPVWITGTAHDPLYIKSLMVNGKKIFQESSQKIISFEEPFLLKEGTHTIELFAKNLSNKETKKELVVQVDRSGPFITIVQTDTVLKGALSDECNIMHLFADGIEVPLSKGNHVSFEIDKRTISDVICLFAEDILGNKTYTNVPLTRQAQNVHFSKNLIASAGFIYQKSTKKFPFYVVVDNWVDGQTIYTDGVSITGKIFTDANIKQVSLDNINFPHGNGKICIFQRTIPLRIGYNRIVISVKDVLKRKYKRTLHIIRQQSRVWQLDQRFCLRFNLFKSIKNSLFSDIFHKYFYKEMIRRKRFQIQGDKTFNRIVLQSVHSNIKEDRVQESALVKGVIHETREGIEVAARIFTRNSKILGFVDVDAFEEDQYSENVQLKANILARALAEKLHQRFPLIDGTIVKIKNGKIWMAPKKGCLKPDQILISRKVIHYKQRIWEDDEIIGYTRIYGKSDNALQIFCKPDVKFAVDDRIITQ